LRQSFTDNSLLSADYSDFTDFGLAWFGKAEAFIFKEKISTSELAQSCSFQLLLLCNLRQTLKNQ
jgi:hypothetical protein